MHHHSFSFIWSQYSYTFRSLLFELLVGCLQYFYRDSSQDESEGKTVLRSALVDVYKGWHCACAWLCGQVSVILWFWRCEVLVHEGYRLMWTCQTQNKEDSITAKQFVCICILLCVPDNPIEWPHFVEKNSGQTSHSIYCMHSNPYFSYWYRYLNIPPFTFTFSCLFFLLHRYFSKCLRRWKTTPWF